MYRRSDSATNWSESYLELINSLWKPFISCVLFALCRRYTNTSAIVGNTNLSDPLVDSLLDFCLLISATYFPSCGTQTCNRVSIENFKRRQSFIESNVDKHFWFHFVRLFAVSKTLMLSICRLSLTIWIRLHDLTAFLKHGAEQLF